MSSIAIKNITKRYGQVLALENVTLNLEPNKIYGLLGRNGAGKTTLLNLMTNRIFPTSGSIAVDGQDVTAGDAGIEKIFYMTEKNFYPRRMTIKEVFKWTSQFYPAFDMEYAARLCDLFELDPKKRVRALSTGYGTIFKIITALASNAEVLLFDEPILGLDAHHRELFYKQLLANYIEKPKTIVLSTHIIEEISDILERVIILKGRGIAADESVERLLDTAYCVSGPAEQIEKYVTGKNCINMDRMASFQAATVVGTVSAEDARLAEELKLEFSKVELQKMFIYLTNSGGGQL